MVSRWKQAQNDVDEIVMKELNNGGNLNNAQLRWLHFAQYGFFVVVRQCCLSLNIHFWCLTISNNTSKMDSIHKLKLYLLQ